MLTESQNMVLLLTAAALFDPSIPIPQSADWDEIRKEAYMQTVPLPVFMEAEKHLPKETKQSWKKQVHGVIANNMRVSYEHCELDRLMKKAGIPYVILKGMASAGYYGQLELRSLGDVDFIVGQEHMERAGKMLEEAGFTTKGDHGGIHIAYHRQPYSVWELHRDLGGLPNGLAGEKCRAYMNDIVETALETESFYGSIRIPDPLHHGFVLLLHTAAHLTSEGIGLRHLCDWAVFYASLSEEEFVTLFEKPLKDCGLWRFACLLTLLSIRYLHAPKRLWAGDVDEVLLEAMITDIFDGGNFGKKDADRYRQIKYISNRGERTVDGKGVIHQLTDTLDKKAKAEHKSRIGVLMEYAGLVIQGKRNLDSRSTLKESEKRKNIYREFHLFEVDKTYDVPG